VRLQFWKRKTKPTPVQPEPATVKRFNVTPRSDVGSAGLPSDPDDAAKMQRLRRRREQLRNELEAAEAAGQEDNKWQREIRLIDQAIGEIEAERKQIGSETIAPGVLLDEVPIEDEVVDLTPSPAVRFRIRDDEFVFEEPAEWAERGFQVARVELEHVAGSVATLVPPGLVDVDRALLSNHLELSLFEFATELRDRALADEPFGNTTLRDLAQPDAEDGGWFDFLGNSPVRTAREAERAKLDAEIERLRSERATLATEQDKLAEEAPVIARRLAEVDREITAIQHSDNQT
jgi:hypothetical protein